MSDRGDNKCIYLGVKGLRNNGLIIFLVMSDRSGISFKRDPRLTRGHFSLICVASGKFSGVCDMVLFCIKGCGV